MNKYVGDMTVTASQMWKNFKEEDNEQKD